MTDEELLELAKQASKKAYCKYSGFSVGAALMCEDGRVFTGCNIENGSYSLTICAERTAIFKAVSEGEKDFTAIAVIGYKRGEKPVEYAFPCGICRQVMAEFCKKDFKVYVAISGEDFKEFRLEELLPESFGSDCFM